jgi:enoyl-CoA hydratase/carnithine racemase
VIRFRIEGPVAVCTMEAPPVNAIDESFLTAFHNGLDMLEDAQVKVLTVRSALKAFCAGAHLGRIGEFFAQADGPAAMVEFVRGFHRLFDRIESLPCVTLAEINGAALGGGLELALSCDLRVAADGAQLGLPEARVGMIPGAGGTQRLPRICGPGVAARLILAAETVSGKEAASLGLVQWSCANETLRARTDAIARNVAGLARNALRAAKDCMRAHYRRDIDGFALELEKPLELMRDPEAAQRIAGFLNR